MNRAAVIKGETEDNVRDLSRSFRLMRKMILTICMMISIQAVMHISVMGRVFQDEEEVVFQIEYPGARSVYIVGDFNGWNPTMDKMVKKGDVFEIRLYLLPGRYGYRFNVDGKSIPDPDNKMTDGKGNSLIIIVQDGDNVRLQLGTEEAPNGISEKSWRKQLGVFALYDRYHNSFFSKIGISDSLNDSFLISANIVSEASADHLDDLFSQHASLLSATGRASFSGIEITGFHRMPFVDLEDPLGVFTTVGPFDYPAGLFFSGIRLKRRLPFGVDGDFFFMNRTLDCDYEVSDTVSERSFKGNKIVSSAKDIDVIAFNLSTKIGGMPVNYLFRLDKRPLRGCLTLPQYGNALFNAFEKVLMSGMSIELDGSSGSRIVFEYLGGRSTVSLFERLLDGATSFDDYRADFHFEKGSRFLVGYSVKRGCVESGIEMRTASIEDIESGRERRKTVLKGFADFTSGCKALKISAELKTFSPGESFLYFQLRANDFWLDGDELYPADIPFLATKGFLELKAELGMGKGLSGAYPSKNDLLLTFVDRVGVEDADRSVTEFKMNKILAFHSLCNFIMDARYVSYQYDGVREDFTSTFIAYYLEWGSRAWVSIGIGVSPYVFDSSIYGYTEWGRERYLVDRGVLDRVGAMDHGSPLNSLFEAEDSMERMRELHLDVGFNF